MTHRITTRGILSVIFVRPSSKALPAGFPTDSKALPAGFEALLADSKTLPADSEAPRASQWTYQLVSRPSQPAPWLSQVKERPSKLAAKPSQLALRHTLFSLTFFSSWYPRPTFCKLFLDASSHLYKRPCLSVRLLVGWSVR